MMAPTQPKGTALHRVRALIAAEQTTGLPDADLLRRFTAARDEGAFAALVRRHGPLVLGVCRRVLGNHADAEDAFQATFLVLARKADAIANHASLPCWLYQVAYRTAVKAKSRQASRRAHEARAERQAGADPLAEVTGRELLSILDEEVQRLPERCRTPLVLCYLEGKTRDEAARALGWSVGTLKRRLEQARGRLRQRLARRGLALPGTLLAAGLCTDGAAAAVSGWLADMAVRTALAQPGALTGRAAVAATLARGTLREMGAARLRAAVVLGFLAAAVSAAVALGAARFVPAPAPSAAPAEPGDAKRQAQVAPAPGDKKLITVAGRVLDADGKPVKDARVGVMAVQEDWYRFTGPEAERMVALGHTQTGAAGEYQLRVPRPVWEKAPPLGDIPPLVVMARAPGHGVSFAAVSEDGKAPRVIRLPREQILRGRFLDLQGQPVKGVKVHVAFAGIVKDGTALGVMQPTAPTPLWFEPAVTDANGRFRLTGIGPEHKVGVTVRDGRFNPERLQLWEKPDERTREVAHVLVPAQYVEGRVSREDTGKPFPDATLHAEGARTRTDREGRYRFNPFRDRYGSMLVAQPPAGQPYLGVTSYLTSPKATVFKQTADFRLPRGVVVRGVVKEAPSGKPVAGAAVYFFAQQTDNPFHRQNVATGPVFPVVSGPGGCFEIIVLPGPGHLVVKGPTSAYIPVAVGRRRLYENKPGGDRHFAHGLLRTDFKPGDGPRAVELTLRRGVPVRGKLVGPDGAAVRGAEMLTRLSTSAPMVIEEVRGVSLPRDAFDLPGCDPDHAYPVVFLHEKKRLGAVLEVSGKQTGKPLTVRLQRCGSAKVRLLDKAGQPLAGHWAEVEMVFTPGPSRFDYKSTQRGLLAADTTNLSNLHQYGFQHNNGRTDEQGSIMLEALVPGVTYRIVASQLGGRVLREFTVRPGETLELKDLRVAAE